MKTMRFSSEQIHFLGVRTLIPWEHLTKEPMKLWEQFYNDQTMERLLTICQAKKVYGVLGYVMDSQTKTVSYDIVCENLAQVTSDEFQPVEIKASKYIAFEEKGIDSAEREREHDALCEEVYKEWLPSSQYVALTDLYEHTVTDGYAVIENVIPRDPSSTNYTIEFWIPVKEK